MGRYVWTAERRRYWARTVKLYNITYEQLNELRTRIIVAQNFRCAICSASFERVIAFLDHDHHSGALRGALCMQCNRFRVARNSVDTAEEVVRYLNRPPAYAVMDSFLKERHESSEDASLSER